MPTKRNTSISADQLVSGVDYETMHVQIFAVRVGGKQMSTTIFRQLPVVDLCDQEANLRSGVRQWGVVRHDIKGINLWMLLWDDGKLYRAAINIHLNTDAHFDARVKHCREMIRLMSDGKMKESYAKDIIGYERERLLEPQRF